MGFFLAIYFYKVYFIILRVITWCSVMCNTQYLKLILRLNIFFFFYKIIISFYKKKLNQFSSYILEMRENVLNRVNNSNVIMKCV